MNLLPQLPNVAIYQTANGWIVKIIKTIKYINPVQEAIDAQQNDPLLSRLTGKAPKTEFPLKDESCFVFSDFVDVLNFLQNEIIRQTNV